MTDHSCEHKTDAVGGVWAEVYNPRITSIGGVEAELLFFYETDNGEATTVPCGNAYLLSRESILGACAVAEQEGLQTTHLVSKILNLGSQLKKSLDSDPSAKSSEGKSSKDSGPDLVKMSTIDPETVDFLWEPYIPLGKLTLVEGDPGTGKTFLMLAIAAAVSRGGKLLDQDGEPEMECDQGNVIYMTCEDGLGDTLRPRLDAIEACCDHVYHLNGQKTKEGKNSPITLNDIPVIDRAFEMLAPRLFIVDPLQGFLGSDIDMHRANEVRPILSKLSALAAKHETAIVLIRHLSKALQAQNLYRGMGSIDITAAARSVIAVGHNPEDKHQHAMVHIKSSLSKEGASMAFALEEGQFRWLGKTELSANDILGPQRGDNNNGKLEGAKNFVLKALQGGPLASTELEKKAKAQGISKATLKRAKTVLQGEGEVTVERINNTWISSLTNVVRGGTNGHLAQEVQEAQNPPRAHDELLELLAQTIENKSVNQEVQEAHMSFLNSGHNTYINQQLTQEAQEAHHRALRGNNGMSPLDELLGDAVQKYDSEPPQGSFQTGRICSHCGSQRFDYGVAKIRCLACGKLSE